MHTIDMREKGPKHREERLVELTERLRNAPGPKEVARLGHELGRITFPWMRYAGMVESGDARSSESIDDVVYPTKRRIRVMR